MDMPVHRHVHWMMAWVQIEAAAQRGEFGNERYEKVRLLRAVARMTVVLSARISERGSETVLRVKAASLEGARLPGWECAQLCRFWMQRSRFLSWKKSSKGMH